MSEKRILDRVNLYYYLRVFDAQSGELLGHMVDINIKGVRLLGKTQLTDGANLSLKMDLPQEFNGHQALIFSGEVRHSREAANPDLFETGILIRDLSSTHIEIIEDLIERFLMTRG
jgi:hypothetical protein